MQKKMTSVINAISTQEISRNGDSQAASALKRVSGISVEGGKYVYVRGLSDRYSMTTLNRAEIPGLDPNRNTVQMDLFPSNIINNIVVHKTFSPSLPGSFTGGYVDIETKDFPEQFTLRLSSSLGYNTNSSLRDDFLTYEGGKTDFLAYDDGTRQWPVNSNEIPFLYQNNDKLDDVTRSFSRNMDVEEKTSFLNHSHAISVGDQVKIGERFLGYNASLSYRKNFRGFTDGTTGRYQLTGANEESLNTERVLNLAQGQEEVLIGGMLSLNYKLTPNHKIGLIGIHNRSGNSIARFLEGERPSDEIGSFQQTRELEYIQRAISSVQLKGSHYFEGLKNLKVNWLSTATNASQSTPDLRYFTNSYFVNNGVRTYEIENAKYSPPARFTREMQEFNLDNKIDFEAPVNFFRQGSKVKVGFANVYKQREFTEQRIDINSQNNNFTGDVNEYFQDDNIGQAAGGVYGIYVQDGSELRNNYNGTQNVLASYAQLDLNVGERLKVQTGARVEMAEISIQSFDTELPEGNLSNTDVLPALNVSYSVLKDMNLRLAASRTIARPTFRELAPYASYDFSTGETKIGNADLQRTTIDNLDLRWEMFLQPGELVSVSAFYKRFTNPIETTFNPIAANPELSWKNVDEANLVGLEIELRKNLNFIPGMKNFKIGTNVTLVKSTVSIDPLELIAIRGTDPDAEDTREMFGQSPFVVNSFLAYDNKELGLNANLSYNMAAAKIAVVIAAGTPNVYEQAFHALNFNIGKDIGKGFSMRLSANNILDSSIRRTYLYNDKEYIYSQFNPGQTFSVGLTYSVN
ncbi:MAG: TonB-dependent receptor, partial [Saprospiraceae bacterium]